jgi:hypothetical protein
MDAAILWLLASLSKSDSARLRPILAIFLMGYLAMTVNSCTFFFSGPVIAELLIVACIAAAIVTARPAVECEDPTSRSELKAAEL